MHIPNQIHVKWLNVAEKKRVAMLIVHYAIWSRCKQLDHERDNCQSLGALAETSDHSVDHSMIIITSGFFVNGLHLSRCNTNHTHPIEFT